MSREKITLPVRFAVGVGLIITISLGIFYLLMQPPISDLTLMAVFLSITAALSGFAGYIAYRLGWIERSPTIRWTLLGGYILASILTFVNVWATAKLMFASQHDLQLATVLLIFAGGIAMSLGYFQTSALTNRIQLVDRAARTIAQGDLDVQIPVKGRDEVALLAETFNKMAEQLQSAMQKQQQAEASRRDLIAWVSHDLQTPLASIRAIVEALADGVVDDPETVQRYLSTASRNIQSLSMLIDNLFQLAQIDAGGLQLECEYNSISDLISDTLESFKELAARQEVHLDGSITSQVDPVYMDAQRIGRVLTNLISNAIRHTPPGGTVKVNAFRTPEGEIRVEISDTGEGIPLEDMQFIFERFYRGEKSRNRETGGAGLGLAIAKGFVEAHHGRISVDSVPDQGTRFVISLPVEESVRSI